MKTAEELRKEHLERLKKAVANEKTDRPPITLNADAFLVQYGGGKVSDLVLNPEYGNECCIKGLQKLGDIDCGGPGTYPPVMGAFAFAKMKVPGRDLADNMIWQIDELRPMTVEDYDVIIDKGFNYYSMEFQKKYLPELEKEMEYWAPLAPKIAQMYKDAGYVTLSGDGDAPFTIAGGVFGGFMSARGSKALLMDIRRIPDKVMAAMEVAYEESSKALREAVRKFKPLTVFTGAAGAGDFLSMKDFDKFIFPQFKNDVDIIVEEGSNCYLHLDLCWDRFIDHLLEFPKNRCVFGPDGTTDMFKAADKLYGHMAFYGDVHPALLTLGTPDEVYAYCKKLMDRVGDKGLIMSTGCSVPANAKPENVEAVIAAALGK
ncbi:MAG: uroporphyrinogen decarboxylase family protein [Clostridiales bacterium]|jgi:uroporphyrinogen decarboxylase|nr:uroporphyrinogen-III decarboxylase [Eubacteriales bacterium]MDH7567873.1 uroporphyrinogen decarboxylase family protein [Clostridiales bacterium]